MSVKLIITNLIIQIPVLNVLILVMNVKMMEMEHNVFNVKQEITELSIPIKNVFVLTITIHNYHHSYV